MRFIDHPATKKFTARYEKDSITLDLSNQSLTGHDMPALAEFLEHHQNITQLILDHNLVGSGLKHLTCKRITYLSITHNTLTDEQVTQFAEALLIVCGPQNNLELLNLEHNKLGDAAARSIAQFDQPLSLYLDHNQIGLDGAIALSENPNWFKMLTLSGNPLSAEAVEILKTRYDGPRGILFFAPADDSPKPSCCTRFCL